VVKQSILEKVDGLNERHVRFCLEYIVDLVGRQAAIRAGYSEDAASHTAWKILNLPEAQAYIQKLLEEKANRTKATADKVISELYHLVSFDPVSILSEDGCLIKDMRSMPAATRKCIAAVDIQETFEGTGDNRVWTGYIKKIKFWDKTKALEMLGKHHKLITDRLEASAPDGGPLLAPAFIIEPVRALQAVEQPNPAS